MTQAPRLDWNVATNGYRRVMGEPVAVKVGSTWLELPVVPPSLTKQVREVLRGGAVSRPTAHREWYVTARLQRGETEPEYAASTPLDNQPKLFEEFAQTAPTKTGILAFANRYGLLGTPTLIRVSSRRSKGQPDIVVGETLSSWRDAIGRVKLACHFQRQIARHHVPEIPTDDPAVLRTNRTALEKQSLDDFLLLTSIPAAPTTLDTTRGAVELVTNHGLNEGVSAHLFWQSQWSEYTCRLRPKHLLGGLWLQFAESIARSRDYTQCETCNRWIEVSRGPAGATKRRRHCSDICRVQAHRKQKAAVLELAKQGMPTVEIAETTGKDPRIVTKWVRESRGGRRSRRDG